MHLGHRAGLRFVLTQLDRLTILPPPQRTRTSATRYRTGKEGRVAHGHRVLLVDGIAETEQVLKAVFEPRGLQVERISTWTLRQGSALPSADVLVLDTDREVSGNPLNGLPQPQLPRVLLGTASWTDSEPESVEPDLPLDSSHRSNNASQPPLRQLSKPFHYTELIQAIESLLPDSTVA